MLPTKFRFIWPSVSEEKIFFNRPIRNKNCLWWPCLLTDRNEMSNHYRGPFIDASYQVLVHLAKPFQRRRFLKLANQKQELPVAAMFVNGSGQHEQSLERTFHRCFIPGFSSFGWGVSEEKIQMWKVSWRQTTDVKWWQKFTLPLARWTNKAGHLTAAGRQANCQSNCIFQIWTCQSESKIRLCFAYWFCRTPPLNSTLELSPPTWKWVECPE
jgi:hypothetical protein